ncbi:MAG: hypothetical protein LUE20_05515 [Oscillospiraceae bacterium]|nr:hypothetical protein [Oscillospiraceae bacterium]
MDIFNVEFAGLTIEIKSRFKYMRWFCQSYITENTTPDFSVQAEDSRLEELRQFSPEMRDEYLERDAIYSAIASKLPYYDRVTLHGACISYKDKSYLFTAASGTGKSTHIALWKRYLGDDVSIVNGDKPIFHVKPDGTIRAYDTPWCGKECWNQRKSGEMAGICFIRRLETPGDKNTISPMKPDEAIPYMLRQMFHPYEEEATGLMLGLFDEILSRLPLWLLECDISEDAVRTSFEAMTGEKYHRAEKETTIEEINKQWRMSR